MALEIDRPGRFGQELLEMGPGSGEQRSRLGEALELHQDLAQVVLGDRQVVAIVAVGDWRATRPSRMAIAVRRVSSPAFHLRESSSKFPRLFSTVARSRNRSGASA